VKVRVEAAGRYRRQKRGMSRGRYQCTSHSNRCLFFQHRAPRRRQQQSHASSHSSRDSTSRCLPNGGSTRARRLNPRAHRNVQDTPLCYEESLPPCRCHAPSSGYAVGVSAKRRRSGKQHIDGSADASAEGASSRGAVAVYATPVQHPCHPANPPTDV